jgi:hypothetical protein
MVKNKKSWQQNQKDKIDYLEGCIAELIERPKSEFAERIRDEYWIYKAVPKQFNDMRLLMLPEDGKIGYKDGEFVFIETENYNSITPENKERMMNGLKPKRNV